MYYDLTETEYKKYEKEFKKTYIGKQYNITRLSTKTIGCVLCLICGFILGYNSIETFKVTLNEFLLFFLGSFCLLLDFLCDLEYKKELKNYIIEKNK